MQQALGIKQIRQKRTSLRLVHLYKCLIKLCSDIIDEVKPIGQLLLAKLKENDYSIVEGNELQIEEDLNTDGVGFKR